MLKLLERLVTFSLIQLTIGTFSVLILGTELREHEIGQADTRSSVVLSVTYALIYAGCALFAVLYYKRVLAAMRVSWPLMALAILAIISTSWSIDPAVTLRRSVVLLGSTVYGIYLGSRYSTTEFQKVLIQSFLLLLAGSVAALAVLPAYVVDPSHTSAFRGLTQHKNLFGEYMGIFLLLAISYRPKQGPVAKAGLILLGAGMLVASQSGTSVLSAAATIAVLPVLLLLRFTVKQRVPLAAGALALLGAAAFFGSQQITALLDLLGKDRTLTGRSVIWEMVLAAISRKLWLGYGFDAFWQGLKGDSLMIVVSAGWLVPHSHNGYLEALLGLGVVGLALIAFCTLRLAKDGAGYLRANRGAEGLWPLAFLIYFLVHATGEPSLLTRDSLSYLLFVAMSTSLALDRKVAKNPSLTREDSKVRLSAGPAEASLFA